MGTRMALGSGIWVSEHGPYPPGQAHVIVEFQNAPSLNSYCYRIDRGSDADAVLIEIVHQVALARAEHSKETTT